jgi:hypothetical protein
MDETVAPREVNVCKDVACCFLLAKRTNPQKRGTPRSPRRFAPRDDSRSLRPSRGQLAATLLAMTIDTLLQRTKHLRVGREIAGGFLGIGQLTIHRDFKHPAATACQSHRGVFHRLQDEIARRTGAWLIASHAAIFDFHLHGSVSQCDNRYAAAIRRRLARGISSASASTGGTSSGLASALSSDSRSAASFRSFSTFSPKTSLT